MATNVTIAQPIDCHYTILADPETYIHKLVLPLTSDAESYKVCEARKLKLVILKMATNLTCLQPIDYTNKMADPKI